MAILLAVMEYASPAEQMLNVQLITLQIYAKSGQLQNMVHWDVHVKLDIRPFTIALTEWVSTIANAAQAETRRVNAAPARIISHLVNINTFKLCLHKMFIILNKPIYNC